MFGGFSGGGAAPLRGAQPKRPAKTTNARHQSTGTLASLTSPIETEILAKTAGIVSEDQARSSAEDLSRNQQQNAAAYKLKGNAIPAPDQKNVLHKKSLHPNRPVTSFGLLGRNNNSSQESGLSYVPGHPDEISVVVRHATTAIQDHTQEDSVSKAQNERHIASESTRTLSKTLSNIDLAEFQDKSRRESFSIESQVEKFGTTNYESVEVWTNFFNSYCKGQINLNNTPRISESVTSFMPLPAPYPPNEDERAETANRYIQVWNRHHTILVENLMAYTSQCLGLSHITLSFFTSEREVRLVQTAPFEEDMSHLPGSRLFSLPGHVLYSDDILIVPDATEDWRFRANPLVAGLPYIKFFAAAPVIAEGQIIGAVAMFDTSARPGFNSRCSLVHLGNYALSLMTDSFKEPSKDTSSLPQFPKEYLEDATKWGLESGRLPKAFAPRAEHEKSAEEEVISLKDFITNPESVLEHDEQHPVAETHYDGRDNIAGYSSSTTSAVVKTLHRKPRMQFGTLETEPVREPFHSRNTSVGQDSRVSNGDGMTSYDAVNRSSSSASSSKQKHRYSVRRLISSEFGRQDMHKNYRSVSEPHPSSKGADAGKPPHLKGSSRVRLPVIGLELQSPFVFAHKSTSIPYEPSPIGYFSRLSMTTTASSSRVDSSLCSDIAHRFGYGLVYIMHTTTPMDLSTGTVGLVIKQIYPPGTEKDLSEKIGGEQRAQHGIALKQGTAVCTTKKRMIGRGEYHSWGVLLSLHIIDSTKPRSHGMVLGAFRKGKMPEDPRAIVQAEDDLQREVNPCIHDLMVEETELNADTNSHNTLGELSESERVSIPRRITQFQDKDAGRPQTRRGGPTDYSALINAQRGLDRERSSAMRQYPSVHTLKVPKTTRFDNGPAPLNNSYANSKFEQHPMGEYMDSSRTRLVSEAFGTADSISFAGSSTRANTEDPIQEGYRSVSASSGPEHKERRLVRESILEEERLRMADRERAFARTQANKELALEDLELLRARERVLKDEKKQVKYRKRAIEDEERVLAEGMLEEDERVRARELLQEERTRIRELFLEEERARARVILAGARSRISLIITEEEERDLARAILESERTQTREHIYERERAQATRVMETLPENETRSTSGGHVLTTRSLPTLDTTESAGQHNAAESSNMAANHNADDLTDTSPILDRYSVQRVNTSVLDNYGLGEPF